MTTDQANDVDEEFFNPTDAQWAVEGEFGEDEGPDYTTLFTAPDMSSFIKRPKTAVSREYENRVRAMFKTGMLYSLRTGNLPDAAAIIKHGPDCSIAMGHLAEANDGTRKLIDFITTPENPYLVAVLTMAPLIAQMFRNRERQIAEIRNAPRMSRAERKAARQEQKANQPPPRFSIKIPGLKPIGIRMKFRFNVLAGFRTQSVPPNSLVYEVFSDKKLIDELDKQGIHVRVRRAE